MLARKHAEDSEPEVIFLDDVFTREQLWSALVSDTAKHLFITDPWTIDHKRRVELYRVIASGSVRSDADRHTEWIYFENDLETAFQNVKSRDDGRVISYQALKQMSLSYTIPNNSLVIPVWKP